ncbi:glycosyltransferase [Ramlibacter montanisoli]|uniref:Glycosyltransferase n=1 Tax=Ramlibacter montanisoli TaxID=2732512 RepID=A0A849KBM2_9BURK|nr:glycosyltransferase [Ramlibacter montanisoli]NNU44820.1 glycosyltransferase [Ramlibacter montanisoli]
MDKQGTPSLFQSLRRKLFGHRVKCFIIHFNRPTFLLRLLEVLSAHPRLDVYVIDNCSRAECRAGAEALADRFGAKFLPMDRNHGHTVVWAQGLSAKYARDEPYLVTDCDVIPNPEVDWLALLEKGLREHPHANKAGLELNVSRIPPAYPKRAEVIAHERTNLYRKVLDAEFQECGVDTTLALYRAGYHDYSVWGTDSNQWAGRCLSLRTVQPQFEADHLGWHLVPPYNEETRRYFEAIRSIAIGHWKD